MDPYRRVARLQARHRRDRHRGAGWAGLLGPVILGGAAAPLARPVLLWFLDAPPDTFVAGLGGIVLRLALALCALGLFAGHETLLRGRDRRVLDPFPIEPAALLAVQRRRLGLRTAGVAGGTCVLLAPLAFEGHVLAAGLGAVVVVSGWLCGIALGLPTQLGAVAVARSPSMQGVLELLRGANPRMQAALIYAPGVSLLLGGGSLYAAASGLEQAVAAAGPSPHVALLALPWLLAGGAVAVTPRLARAHWYTATTVVLEVDAAWEQLEDPEPNARVYLDWTARWVPATLRPHYLKQLRAGWRASRMGVLGCWGMGALAALAGWNRDPGAPSDMRALAAAGIFALAGLAIRLRAHDPPWLDRALAQPSPASLGAAFLVVWAWLQGVVLPGIGVTWIRHGEGPLEPLLHLELLAVLAAAVAVACSPLRSRAVLPYVPLAVAGWLWFVN